MTRVLTDRDLDEIELSPEAAKIINWRQQWLSTAGYSRYNAELIATATTIDWRYACDLLKNCKARGYDEAFVMELLF